MSNSNRPMIFGLALSFLCIAAVAWMLTRIPGPQDAGRAVPVDRAAKERQQASKASDTAAKPALFNDGKNFQDPNAIANGGLTIAIRFTGEIEDSSSLQQMRKAIERRDIVALAVLRDELERLEQDPNTSQQELARQYFQIGSLLTYQGKLEEAIKAVEKAYAVGKASGLDRGVLANLTALRGIIEMRRGEVENCIGCVGPSSCILPISKAAMHTKPAGSREAIKSFTEYLAQAPGDLRIRWLLNLAYMTLGEYPSKVPSKYLVPLDFLASKGDAGRFANIAPNVGLISRGPNQAGGSVFDDFTGDGLPDLFLTSLDTDRGASLFVNNGKGKFEDHSAKAGLSDQVYALNAVRADFDNDGNPDVLLLRGGWEKPLRMSLLRNVGNGKFEDVTIDSGLGEPIASETAAWGDYDNDGLLDLFVGGEYRSPFPEQENSSHDDRNRCRLYHNQGNGKFVNVAEKLGVAEEQCSKGCAWGDYDADGRLDLFVSNMNAPCRLYHQEQDGTFRDVANELAVTGPARPFSCWFFDYDNDGLLDLYVNDYSSSLAQFVALLIKDPVKQPSQPRLYRNVGNGKFQDVTNDVGLNVDMTPMGANFGDIDNDGFLDMYFGTGLMALETLVPNVMLKNDGGRKFLDITLSSGTGHLQKGHGVSFADWNCDGYLDLFIEAGGAVPGDRAYNLLFQNPNSGKHWLKVKLVGTKTNRSALGARIKAVVKAADGSERSIHRTIGNNGSFGGNSLVELVGLQDATSVAELQITWPTSGTTQTFKDVPADQAVEITESIDTLKSLPQQKVTVPQDEEAK